MSTFIWANLRTSVKSDYKTNVDINSNQGICDYKTSSLWTGSEFRYNELSIGLMM